MSKLSQLKQDAYQAGKKRNWEEAVALYERILEVDKNNPTVINEMGDLCLKAGKTAQAVRQFLSAAAKYRQTGLLNNAVAIYKKILRYEAHNLNAHWYLAETRSSQGLMVEGEIHALHFLDGSEKLTGDLKEIFLKRCVQLLELYSNCEQILGRLVLIFNTWEMRLESARATLLHAAVAWDTGREDEARSMAEPVVTGVPEIRNYPELQRWMQRVDPDGANQGVSDYGTVELDAGPETAPEPVEDEPVVEVAAEPAPTPAPIPAPTPAPTPEPVLDNVAEDGAIAIDGDGDADFAELIAAAAGTAAAADEADAEEEVVIAVDADVADTADEEPADDSPKVDLLAEMLADDSDLLSGGATSQLESITREIGAQVGGEGNENDPESLYNTGTVYLEMGMYDQAWAAFSKVVETGDVDFALRAREMWGVALQHAERHDEAVEILRQGLDEVGDDVPARMGLLYNIAKSCEAANRPAEARAAYQEISATTNGYLDVEDRLAELSAV